MSDSSNLYICIDCELANANAAPTTLDVHGMCAKCGSSSVVPVDTLVELDAKRKRDSEAPLRETSDEHTKHRIQAMRAQRRRDSEPLREFLRTRVAEATHSWLSMNESLISHSVDTTNSLEAALTQWDGWAWELHYPWEPDAVDKEHFVVELIQGVSHGPRWLIKLDAQANEVTSFQNGTS